MGHDAFKIRSLSPPSIPATRSENSSRLPFSSRENITQTTKSIENTSINLGVFFGVSGNVATRKKGSKMLKIKYTIGQHDHREIDINWNNLDQDAKDVFPDGSIVDYGNGWSSPISESEAIDMLID